MGRALILVSADAGCHGDRHHRRRRPQFLNWSESAEYNKNIRLTDQPVRRGTRLRTGQKGIVGLYVRCEESPHENESGNVQKRDEGRSEYTWFVSYNLEQHPCQPKRQKLRLKPRKSLKNFGCDAPLKRTDIQNYWR